MFNLFNDSLGYNSGYLSLINVRTRIGNEFFYNMPLEIIQKYTEYKSMDKNDFHRLCCACDDYEILKSFNVEDTKVNYSQNINCEEVAAVIALGLYLLKEKIDFNDTLFFGQDQLNLSTKEAHFLILNMT